MQKKKTIIMMIVLCLIALAVVLFIIANKGPVIFVNNCNENRITNSRICCNKNVYYYIGEDESIFYLSQNGKPEKLVEHKVDSIACNSSNIYAATLNSNQILQMDFSGKIINSYFSDNISIDYIYADENAVIYVVTSTYFVLDAETLRPLSINDLMNNPEAVKSGDYNIISGNGYTIVNKAPTVDLESSEFIGTLYIDDKTINLTNDKGIGMSTSSYYIYASNHPFCVENTEKEKQFILECNSDLRHISICDDIMTTFASEYSNNGILRPLYKKELRYDPLQYAIKNEVSLLYHSYDELFLLDCNSEEVLSRKTKSGEKVLYLSNQKAITYYKGQYLTYSLSDWEVIKEQNADEIKNGGSYTFESCGEYIFVFDDKQGKLINTIGI